ncbi:MAG: Do family serine endopeptidase [Pseudomonadota bacterium]
MTTRTILQICSIFLIMVGATAFAQPKEAPQSREQVMLSFSPVVKRVSPAVVNIYTKRVVTRRVSPFMGDPFFDQFFGGGFGGLSRKQVENSLGSGVIVEADGLVITNAHVIKGADEISVVLSDGREFDAKLSLLDEPSDLAVLRMNTEGEKMPFVTLRPSETLEVGDIVIAVGNPFGVGQTVTSGIVSALARSSLNINDFNFFIQTDAAINPGNSGGPLVAMDGSVVGINTAIYSRDGGSLGIGFAVPSEMVNTVIAAEKSGRMGDEGVIRPWIGVSAQTVTSDIADSLGLNRPTGVLIADLHSVSPAKKAGLESGDVVVAVNGKQVRDPAEMRFRLATVPLGEAANLEYLRQGEKRTAELTAMAPPEIPARETTVLEGAHPFNGVTVSNLNPAVAIELGLKGDDENAVVVTAVNPRTAGYRVVRPGDIILAINDDEIEDIKDLKRELSQGERRGGWALLLERNGRKTQIVVR